MVDVPLSPRLQELARSTGVEAGRAAAAGERPIPCPWDANGGSLTYARLAGVWSEAFLSVRPLPTGEPPK